jgi:molybdopterin-containing oxidoreductase family iron-sulfur binding subunit
MKRLPIVDKSRPASAGATDPNERVWYQTLAERDGAPEIQDKRVTEFEGPTPFAPPPGVDRRTFMTLMGASMALAGGLSGCRKPKEKLLPHTRLPEGMVMGQPDYYATAIPFYGTAVGLLVKSYDGRPIKIEGNPDHPESRGASTAWIQASVLDLYDPDRKRAARNAQGEQTVEARDAFLAQLLKETRNKRGRGAAILFEDHRSPATARLLEEVKKELPDLKAYRFEAFGRQNQRFGVQLAFGEPRDVCYRLEKSDVVVSLDADLLGTESSPVRNSKAFAKRRRPESTQAGTAGVMNRIYVAEPSPTQTGHAADHRLRVQAKRVGDLLQGLASALKAAGVPLADGLGVASPKLGEKEQKWVKAAASDLAKAKGAGLVAVGVRQAPALHALAMAINHALGAIGQTVELTLMLDDLPEGPNALKDLVAELNGGKVETLLILGGNPVFNAPADLGFAEAIKKAKTSVHVSSHLDETSAVTTWHVPRAHYLESWSDVRSEDGTLAVVQPLIAPLHDGLTDAQILEGLAGGNRTPFKIVEDSWRSLLGAAGFDPIFKTAIHDGHFVPAPELVKDTTPPALVAPAIVTELGKLAPVQGDFEVVFAPDPHAYDGRYANNGWLLELPDPIHKCTWMTVGAISHATAKKLGLTDGDFIDVTVEGKKVTVPVVLSAGHADDSITLPVGLGRTAELSVGKGVGVNVGVVRTMAAWSFGAATAAKGSSRQRLAVTQGHFVMEGRPLIRTQTADEYKADPSWAAELVKHPPLLNLFADWKYDGHKWAMAIDLTLCTGCSACVTACQAENNIPVIGVDGVLKSREMHWIRIDRYFAGRNGEVEGEDEAEAAFMPMLCQHCENAPCEQVCPVAATTHSPEGINEMTYNRCIGTKYCGNNCPYKVRRFNYFNWNAEMSEYEKLVKNPDVTVRFRGVMEKCTFCVQRVNKSKIQAKIANDRDKSPENAFEIMNAVQTACMQACPTEAITFGDLNNPRTTTPEGRSSVSHLAKLGRGYHMLEEINVRPRISYLARIQNPHPDLAPPKKPAAAGGGHGEAASKEKH